MNEIEVKINKLAQEIIDLDSGIDWFGSHSYEEKQQILHSLAYVIIQSHPRPNEIDFAVKKSGLKESFTPCVLIKTNPLREALEKIQNLPESECYKSFVLGIYIFKVADGRRRNTTCKNGCTHWWHNLDRL